MTTAKDKKTTINNHSVELPTLKISKSKKVADYILEYTELEVKDYDFKNLKKGMAYLLKNQGGLE